MGQVAQDGQKFQYECTTCGQRYNDKRTANGHKNYFKKQGHDFFRMTGRESKMTKGHDQFRKVLVKQPGPMFGDDRAPNGMHTRDMGRE